MVVRNEICLIQRLIVLSDQSVQLVVCIADGQTLVFVNVECLWARAIFPHSKKGRISPAFLALIEFYTIKIVFNNHLPDMMYVFSRIMFT